MVTEEQNERYRAPALDKGLDILEALADAETGLTQIELAKSLNRSPNEFYRMLDRLCRRRYVMRTADDRYVLTLKMFALAQRHRPSRLILNSSIAPMHDLAVQLEQSCHLALHDCGEIVYIANSEPRNYWGVSVRKGVRAQLHDTGSGRVLLAFATPEEREAMLKSVADLRWQELSPEIENRLALIQKRGYEAVESQHIESVTNISAPVLGPGGSAVAALTIPFFKRLDRADPLTVKDCIAPLKRAASQISLNMAGNVSGE